MDLGFKIQKTNLVIRSASSRYQVCQFSSKMDKFDLFGQLWPKMDFLRKQMLKQESASSRYHGCQLLDKTNNFDIFGPNLPKKELKVESS